LRIRRIQIVQWRHFQNLEIVLNSEAGLVCIVGANGTGKSHLLELIAACAHKLGLSQGIDLPRGDPFNDAHDFSLQFYLAPGVSAPVDQGLLGQAGFAQWDRTLTIISRKLEQGHTQTIEAGGVADVQQNQALATSIVNALRGSQDVHFVSLDADRAYPKKNIQIHEIAQAYEIDWEGLEYTRGRSFKTTTALYDEWIKYFLAQENQSGTRLIAEIRRAREAGGQDPRFADHFLGYKEALQKVLPHIVFVGVDSKGKTLLFDTTGMELSFNQLSGGEREIAFLVGQIDRFQLKHGLFLLDEPELHLNADLIRSWVAYLTSTVTSGQIWLATHSLEAVEAAGQQATFILERNPETRKVDSLARLDTRPVLSALARAVGTPAFSISQLRFVFVEGEASVGERERFRNLAGSTTDYRFMECGSGNEVTRRVSAIRALSNEAEAGIRIGGVVDRDWKSDAEAQRLADEYQVFVLPIHEVENFFLYPATMRVLLDQNGCGHIDPLRLLKDASDARAGSWIFQYAMATPNARNLPDIPEAAKDRAKNLTWPQLEADRVGANAEIVASSRFAGDDAAKLTQLVGIGANAYARKRDEQSLWKTCEGKQVLNATARSMGFADQQALTQATFAFWSRNQAQIPEELASLRNYLAAL
jgi:predicted ATPase